MLISENCKNIHVVMATVFCGRNPVNKTLRLKPILHFNCNSGPSAKQHIPQYYVEQCHYDTFILVDHMALATRPKMKTETMYQTGSISQHFD
jgi:hypothetical protein